MQRCVIFGAAAFDRLIMPIDSGDLVIGADGGMVHLNRLGLQPNVILGDFDSLGYVPEGAQVFPVEKDDTDSMLAVRCGLERGCTEFLFYGCLDGERLDHTLSNYQTLSYLCSSGARGYLIGRRQIVTVLEGEAVRFSPTAKGILSVFAVGGEARGVTLRGLQYTLEDGVLSPIFPLGVSNHFVGKPAEISVKTGKVLMIWDAENGIPHIS